MAQKKITDLQLISNITDAASWILDTGLQTYRASSVQIRNYILSAASIAAGMENESITNSKLSTQVANRIGGKLLSRQIFTTLGANTYNKNTNAAYIRVLVVGGGGGGGGISSGSGQAASGGGGGGGWSEKIIQNTSVGTTETVTVGAGGAGGAAGNNTGSTGGTSSFGSHCSATGGTGGTGMTNTTGAARSVSGVGGEGSGGDLNGKGTVGTGGSVTNGGTVGTGTSGASYFGGGLNSTSNAVGVSASIYGEGGGATQNFSGQSARAGGAGGQGVVIVEEYS